MRSAEICRMSSFVPPRCSVPPDSALALNERLQHDQQLSELGPRIVDRLDDDMQLLLLVAAV